MDYIIGNIGDKTVVLTVIGSTLMAAEEFSRPVEHDASESNCNGEDFVVETENKRNSGPDNPEHTLRDEKPINSYEKLKEIIKNPDRILDFGNRRYLLKRFEGGKTAVIKLHKNLDPTLSDVVFELITQLTDSNRLYDSMDDAVDDMEEDIEDDDPTRDIDC
ncbi:hypothetical protein [Halapricum salinum]|uniref:Uncharacterized protein n=1 Tax=Halapricum salinum TaxID=1457250 RepID=A0A4D6HD71_9EURY|nr:hypothetical protein [Halapricum salinum]QCC52024.1 hypothetical protein DV733_12650 [Halapricum salinum]